MDITNDVVCELNSRFHFLCITPNSENILSYKPSDLMGRDLFDFIYPNDLFIIKSIFENSIKNFSSAYCLFRFRSKTRQWLLRDCHMKPFKASTGETRLMVNFKSVSESSLELQNEVKKQNEELGRLDEYLNQRLNDLKALYTVTKAVHQSIDLKEVYRIALDTIMSLKNVNMAFIYLVDEVRKEAVLETYRNVPESYIKKVSRIPKGVGITWKILDSGKLLNVEDIQKSNEIGPAGKDLGNIGVLGAPLTVDGKVIGVIYFTTHRYRKFDHSEVSLFSSISDQLSLAISKAQVYEQLRKTNKREKIISAVTMNVHRSINLKSVLQNAVGSINKNVPGADCVAIYMANGGKAVLNSHSNNHTDTNLINIFTLDVSGVTSKILNEGKPIIDNKVSSGSEYRIDFIDSATSVKSYLGLPLRHKKHIIGTLNITSSRDNAFDHRELAFFNIVTRQIESAIDNAWMAEALKESEKRYRELYENVPTGIYCKSHDGKIFMANSTLIQMLGFHSFDEMASKYRMRSEFLADSPGHTLKNILKKRSKITELESTWLKRTDIDIKFSSSICGSPPDPKVSKAVFRIFQESFTNILRHAQATKVTVSLQKKRDYIKLCIKDNGKGITESSIYNVDSLGLLGIKERAHALRGNVRIKGAPGRGTSIKVQIPIEGELKLKS
ncbi:MAG: GAF domain-containing protein [Deltaproteobacteria bacterium]